MTKTDSVLPKVSRVAWVKLAGRDSGVQHKNNMLNIHRAWPTL